MRPEDADAVRALVVLERESAVLAWPWERPLTPYRQQMDLRHGYEGEGDVAFLVREDGEDVGAVVLYTTEYDNPEVAWVTLLVRPGRRRRGVGRRALDLALAECRARDRSSIVLYGWEGPGLRGLAAAAGFEEKSVEARRVQALDGSASERARFEELHARAAAVATDYELVRFPGRTPEEFLPHLLAVTAAINDAPTDDLDIEDEVFDLGRLRAYETAQLEGGHRLLRLVARHRTSGEVAGHTVVVVDSEQPAWAEQHDTTVVPAHRGHRLGLLLKTGMLLWLAEDEPQVRHVLTENAVSNDPMIAVNDAIGMRLAGVMPVFQRRI